MWPESEGRIETVVFGGLPVGQVGRHSSDREGTTVRISKYGNADDGSTHRMFLSNRMVRAPPNVDPRGNHYGRSESPGLDVTAARVDRPV
jgi:hypothetical protein